MGGCSMSIYTAQSAEQLLRTMLSKQKSGDNPQNRVNILRPVISCCGHTLKESNTKGRYLVSDRDRGTSFLLTGLRLLDYRPRQLLKQRGLRIWLFQRRNRFACVAAFARFGVKRNFCQERNMQKLRCPRPAAFAKYVNPFAVVF